MEIITAEEICINEVKYCDNDTIEFSGSYEDYTKKYIAIDDDVKQALSLYWHLKNHPEVQDAPINKGIPMCKICDKTSEQIRDDEWESLSTSEKPKELNNGFNSDSLRSQDQT